MFWTQSFIPTLKQAPQEAEVASHRLMLRAGLVRMLISGVYSFLPLGLTVLEKIEGIIRKHMKPVGAEELLLPNLQPLRLWKKTGRDEELAETLIRFKDRRGRQLCLGPTHEEVITELVAGHVSSYRQLPLVLYQIQTKFRDEPRPRFGLIRSCEFIMKDAYSFDVDQKGLLRSYEKMRQAYCRIFQDCGLRFVNVKADPGVMGGKVSHEFMAPADSGEDKILWCSHCNYGEAAGQKTKAHCPGCDRKLGLQSVIEVGHIFQLGTRYSKLQGASYIDNKGKRHLIIMGCYGIGVTRTLSAIIEQNHDSFGIIWPKTVAPFQVLILPVNIADPVTRKSAMRIYRDLRRSRLEVLLDDRDEGPGIKFKDADLIGIPLRVTIGQRRLKEGKVEIRIRKTGQVILAEEERLAGSVKKVLKEL